MAHGAVRQWETVIELLGRIDGSAAASTHALQFIRLLDDLKHADPAPRAVWKKLSQQKVPLRLMQACAQHMQGLQPTTALAARAASVFWTAARSANAVHTRFKACQAQLGSLDGSSSNGDTQGLTGSTSSSTAPALSAALLLQLQQSGLLQLLPAVLSAASQQLQRAAAAAAGAGGVDAAGGDAKLQQDMLKQLLSLACTLVQLPPERSGLVFVPLPAVAGLTLSSLRYLKSIDAASGAGQQQQQQGAWKPQTETQHLLAFVVSTTTYALLGAFMSLIADFTRRGAHLGPTGSGYSSSSSSSAAVSQPTKAAYAAAVQVLCSEECLLFVALLTIRIALALMAQQQAEAGGNRDSGSSGSGSGSNSCRTSRQDQGPGCLPPQLLAVLQHAGCSTDAVYARRLNESLTFTELQGTLLLYVQFAEAQNMVAALLQGRQQQQRRMAVLHRLMCSALLQLAHMFVRLSVPHMDACSKCCVAALFLLRQAQRLEEMQQAAGSSIGSSGGNSTPSSSISSSGGNGTPSSSSTPDQHTSAQQQQGVVSNNMLLEQVQDLLQDLLQLWGSTTAALNAADAPVGLRLPESSSSSSGGSTATEQASVPAVLWVGRGPVILRCISRSINVLSAALLPELYSCPTAEGPAHSSSAGGQQEQALTAVRLCSLLSQQTRMTIEAVRLSGSSSALVLRQLGQLLASVMHAAAADLLHALQYIALRNELWKQLFDTVEASADPGGPVERHVLHLPFNLLKACSSIDSTLLQQQPGIDSASILLMCASMSMVAVRGVNWQAALVLKDDASLTAPAAPPPPPPAAAAAATATQAGSCMLLQPGTAAAVTASGAAAEASAAELPEAAAAQASSNCCPAHPKLVLPWLVLLGRCCLLWAHWLQQLSAMQVSESHPEQLLSKWEGQVVWDVTAAAAAADPWSILPGQCCIAQGPASKTQCWWGVPAATVGLGMCIQHTAAAVSAWLATGSNMQQLADLGYNDLQPLQAALVQLGADAAAIETAMQMVLPREPTTAAELAAVQAICRTERASVIGLCPQLQVVGEALTAFAIKLACNNPGCVNASGPSEARLVGGKSCVCGGCLTARYCSRACLKQHWKVHKPVCKALAAAAEAASSRSSQQPRCSSSC